MMVQGSSADSALSSLSDIQHYSEDVGLFCGRVRSFHEMLSDMDSLSQQYQNTLARDESIARSFGKILNVDKLDRSLESLMGSPGPTLVPSQGPGEHLDWHLIRQMYSSGGNVEPQRDGTFHCHIRDLNVTARLSTYEHDIMASGAPENLLNPWRYPQDIHIEQEAISFLKREIEELNQLTTEVIQKNINLIQSLDNRSSTLEDNLQRHNTIFTPGIPANSDTGGFIHPEKLEEPPKSRKNSPWKPHIKKKIFRWLKKEADEGKDRETIEKDFLRDFGEPRSYPAMDAQARQNKGKGNLKYVPKTFRGSPRVTKFNIPTHSSDTRPTRPRKPIETFLHSETSEGTESSRLLTHLESAQVSEHREASDGTEAFYPDENIQYSEAVPPASSASARITMHDLVTRDEQHDLPVSYRPTSGLPLPVMGYAEQVGLPESQSIQASDGYSSGSYIYAGPSFSPSRNTARLSLPDPRYNPTDLG